MSLKKPKILAVILARGGSKGIPKKPIIPKIEDIGITFASIAIKAILIDLNKIKNIINKIIITKPKVFICESNND